MIKFWSIAKNTFIQTIRQPIFGLMIFLTFIVLVISVPLSGSTMGTDYELSDQQQLQTLGLSTILVGGMFTAAFCASSSINKEIRDKTALTVISKPVARAVFVLGKFIGIVASVTLFYYLASLVFMVTVRHHVVSSASAPIDWPVIVIGCIAIALSLLLATFGNYTFGWGFISTTVISLGVFLTAAVAIIAFVGKGWTYIPFSETFGPENISNQLLVGTFLIYLAVIVLTSVAIAASTRVGQIMTLLICIFVLFVGSWLPWILAQLGPVITGSEKPVPAIKILGWALPQLTIFYPMDALAKGRAFDPALVGTISGYFGCYIAGILAIAVGLFQTRELASQGSSSSIPGAVSLLSGLGRISAIVVGIAGVVMLTMPTSHTTSGFIIIGVMLVTAAIAWVVWTGLGNGKKWSWWLITVISAVQVTFWVFLLPYLWAQKLRADVPLSQMQIMLTAAIGTVVLIILFLPKTRRHFKHSKKI
jgi:ABC-2 type transport system permease protein